MPDEKLRKVEGLQQNDYWLVVKLNRKQRSALKMAAAIRGVSIEAMTRRLLDSGLNIGSGTAGNA